MLSGMSESVRPVTPERVTLERRSMREETARFAVYCEMLGAFGYCADEYLKISEERLFLSIWSWVST